MNLPLVSAVIPTYNYGRFVTEAVESALAQTYPNLEIIVVDDGSTDDTKERLAPYMSRIRYIYQENQGLSAARNTGICAAQGDWVAFLDSDDLWHPRKTEIQMQYVLENPSVSLLGAMRVNDNEVAGGWKDVDDKLERYGIPIRLSDLLIKTRFGPSSVIARKCIFEHVGFFDTSLRSAEDRDMWMRIAAKYEMARIEAPLWFYRVHPTSMSANAPRMEANIHRVLRKCVATVPELQSYRAWSLRRKAWAYCDYECAYMYKVAQQRRIAFLRLLRSIVLYPGNFGTNDCRVPLGRLKMLLVLAFVPAR